MKAIKSFVTITKTILKYGAVVMAIVTAFEVLVSELEKIKGVKELNENANENE